MREIKFRAWNNIKKKMMDWYEVQDDLTFFVFDNDVIYKIMQFTGLKDKNGKEIYEGDIVKVQRFKTKFFNAPIEYSLAEFIINGGLGFYKRLSNTETERIEVIGNKFENPELLKEAGK